ncbi:MAG TPA: putative zinc-binding metallopeptidase, partial [Pseudonocardiaceae bacterium]|nr:putative zinc-binding metallopeptidase [Pseudonocardiaceae bacterium]
MRSFDCPRCDQLVFFENTECLRCGAELGFDAGQRSIVLADGAQRCANQQLASCNWLVTDGESLCASCRLTRTRPPETDADAMVAFADAEAAKRRLVFQLLELGLPLRSWADEPGGLGYDLLSSTEETVVTGHEDGIVTIDLAESDDPHREQVRLEMGEPYRTMLGHMRHETGHYYWPVLIERAGRLADFRERFGDERADYAEAMTRHYEQGAPAGWENEHVSAYATMHPWEDWAETFAHYLHIRDTLQTAAAFGIRVEGRDEALSANPEETDADSGDFQSILDDWLPLCYALNAVNRSMGRDDLYPFVLSPPVIGKLSWVHAMTTRATTERSGSGTIRRHWSRVSGSTSARGMVTGFLEGVRSGRQPRGRQAG